MAWNDSAPDPDIAKSAAWDAMPPDSDISSDTKSPRGLLSNVLDNTGRILNPISFVKGAGEQVKQGAFDMPLEATNTLSNTVAKAVGGEEDPNVDAEQSTAGHLLHDPTMERRAEEVANSEPVKNPVDFAYKNPVDTAMLLSAPVLPFMGRLPKVPEVGEIPLTTEAAIPESPIAEPKAPSTIGQRLGARTTAQALDINPLSMRKLAAKAGVSPEQAVLDLGNKANELIPNLVEPLDSANSKFTKVLDAHDEAGAKIGKIARDVTSGTPSTLPEGQEAIAALRKAADEYYQVDGGDLALAKTADRLESLQKAGKLDFDRLSKVKSDIGKGFNKTDPPAGTEDIYHILDEHAQKVVDRLSVQDPTLAPELDHLKQVYTTTSRLLPAMSRTAAREVAGASMGSGILSKAIPSAIGGMMGGPVGALAGAGAKFLQEAIAPDLGKNLAYMAMKSSPELIAAVQKAFPDLSKTAAASIAARIAKQQNPDGMYQGGKVPDDIRSYVSKC